MAHRIYRRYAEPNALRTRRHEIEQCLSEFGLAPGRHRRLHRPPEAEPGQTHGRRLCMALTRLGPVFASFGLYMSSRVDLLPLPDCQALAAIPDQGPATPLPALQALVEREISPSPEEVFTVFEAEPWESRLISQSHRAQLRSGADVMVKVVHPEVQEFLDRDLELLPMLRPAFLEREAWGVLLDDAIGDFYRCIRQQTDLLHEAKDYEALDQDAQEFEMLKIPQVHQAFCSPKLLMLERLSGRTLKEIHEACAAIRVGRDTGLFGMTGGQRALNDLAHRLCLVWLRQTLMGQRFPVELRLEDLMLLPNKQIAFTGGVFTSLPAEAKNNMWRYLIAAATEEPDQACMSLLREVIPDGASVDVDELRYRFREIVPFRDSRLSSGGASNSLADYLLIHWQLISERGLRPKTHVTRFYRGLFNTVETTKSLIDTDDPLLKGLQDVRTIEMLEQFQKVMEFDEMSSNFDKYAAIMMQMPRKLDAVLTWGAESSARQKLQSTRPSQHHRDRSGMAVIISLSLVLVAVVVLSHHLAAVTVADVWVDRIGAIVFVVFGALMLRMVSRV